MEISNYQNKISKDEWDEILSILKNILNIYEDITLDENTNKFCEWLKEDELSEDKQEAKSLPNHYLYKDHTTNRLVDLEFGSIHSVKGKTHLATLVLETFYQNHYMKSILPDLCGESSKKKSKTYQMKLKCQYVAMTRARALVCLAIPIDFVDEQAQKKLKKSDGK